MYIVKDIRVLVILIVYMTTYIHASSYQHIYYQVIKHARWWWWQLASINIAIVDAKMIIMTLITIARHSQSCMKPLRLN